MWRPDDTLEQQYESLKRANNFLRTGRRYLPGERTPRDEKWRLRAVALRKRLSATQKDFAAMVGVERSVVASWEMGRAAPTRKAPLAGQIRRRIDRLERVAKAVMPSRTPEFSLQNKPEVIEL